MTNLPLYYPLADSKVQNFVNKYPGKEISPNVLLLHTMEVNGFPGYQYGNVAPHLSLVTKLDGDGNLLSYKWRQHFPFTRTARAIRNLRGGVETNNSAQGIIQVELGGTSGWDSKVKPNWSDPEQLKKIAAPLVDLVVFANTQLNIPLVAPYDFYAWNDGRGHRMTFAEWMKFRGICGHQHAPENIHSDPGKIDINYLIALAKVKIDASNSDNGNSTPDTPSNPGDTDPVPVPVPVPNVLVINRRFDKPTIAALQWVIGLRGDNIDGIWGPITKKAFQKWLFVKQDLIIGPITVKALQKRLGFKGDDVDGIWGPNTNQFLQLYINRKILAARTVLNA